MLLELDQRRRFFLVTMSAAIFKTAAVVYLECLLRSFGPADHAYLDTTVVTEAIVYAVVYLREDRMRTYTIECLLDGCSYPRFRYLGYLGYLIHGHWRIAVIELVLQQTVVFQLTCAYVVVACTCFARHRNHATKNTAEELASFRVFMLQVGKYLLLDILRLLHELGNHLVENSNSDCFPCACRSYFLTDSSWFSCQFSFSWKGFSAFLLWGLSRLWCGCALLASVYARGLSTHRNLSPWRSCSTVCVIAP